MAMSLTPTTGLNLSTDIEMTDPYQIIRKYYDESAPLFGVLTLHSEMVTRKALECGARSEIELDLEFVREAAMLHDIGVFRCYAPDIYCTGTLPYIAHGTEGRKILEEEGLPRHALVCERHTGSGLTIEDIIAQKLPLPLRDMTPKSPEEKLICYADKFFSKSGDIEKEKDLSEVMASMARHGEASLKRFMALHEMFSR